MLSTPGYVFSENGHVEKVDLERAIEELDGHEDAISQIEALEEAHVEALKQAAEELDAEKGEHRATLERARDLQKELDAR